MCNGNPLVLNHLAHLAACALPVPPTTFASSSGFGVERTRRRGSNTTCGCWRRLPGPGARSSSLRTSSPVTSQPRPDAWIRQGIAWTTDPLPLFDLWRLSAQSRLNVLRLGMHHCVPWRMMDVLAMGGCPVLDCDPYTLWPQPLERNQNYLSLDAAPPPGESLAYGEPVCRDPGADRAIPRRCRDNRAGAPNQSGRLRSRPRAVCRRSSDLSADHDAGQSQVSPPMSEPLVIVHVVFSLDLGGLERVVVDLVRESEGLGQRVSVVCLQQPGRLAPQVEALGARVACLGKPSGLHLRTIGRIETLLRHAPTRRRAHAPDRGPLLRRSGWPARGRAGGRAHRARQALPRPVPDAVAGKAGGELRGSGSSASRRTLRRRPSHSASSRPGKSTSFPTVLIRPGSGWVAIGLQCDGRSACLPRRS